MRVKMTKLECGPNGNFYPGEEREVTEAHGQSLVDSNCALLIKPFTREVAVLPAQEIADLPENIKPPKPPKPPKRK